jgi:methyl-accepting chemotaxis protein
MADDLIVELLFNTSQAEKQLEKLENTGLEIDVSAAPGGFEAVNGAIAKTEQSAGKLGDSIKNGFEASKAAAEKLGDGITTEFATSRAAAEKLGDSAKAAADGIAKMSDAKPDVSGIERAAASVGNLGAESKKAQEGVSHISDSGGMDKLLFTVDSMLAALEHIYGEAHRSADGIASVAKSSGEAAEAFKNMSSSADKAGDGLEKVGEESQKLKKHAETLEQTFSKTFTASQAAGDKFGKSIKTGLGEALKKASEPVKNLGKGIADFAKTGIKEAKNVGNAFLHPIQTIKGKFTGAMKDAADGTKKVGDSAKKVKKK